jgi:hypothetical protein
LRTQLLSAGRLLEACGRTFDCGSQLVDLALLLGLTLHFELQRSVTKSDDREWARRNTKEQ